jgi:hypothetical protein
MALDLNAEPAQALRKAVFATHDTLHKTHVDYHINLPILLGRNDSTAIREEGHRFARAVVEYSHAVMDWLTYADKQLMEEDRGMAAGEP